MKTRSLVMLLAVIAGTMTLAACSGARRPRPTSPGVAVATTPGRSSRPSTESIRPSTPIASPTATRSTPPVTPTGATPVASTPVASTPAPVTTPSVTPPPPTSQPPTSPPPTSPPPTSPPLLTPPPTSPPPPSGPPAIEDGFALVVAGGDLAGQYVVPQNVPCVIGFLTETDFYYAGGIVDPANAADPTKNVRVTLGIPDAQAAARGTPTFSLVLNFGNPAQPQGYRIETTGATGTRVGSGVTTLTIEGTSATVRFTGQAARIGVEDQGDQVVTLQGTIGCTQVLRPRG